MITYRSAIVVVLLVLAAIPADAAEPIFWADAAAIPPTNQEGPLKHVGRLLYTPLHFCGGSCVWAGDRWVLTSRHGVAKWSNQSLSVQFPAHHQLVYSVAKIHLPPGDHIDIALLELKEAIPFEQPPTLDDRIVPEDALLHFGGYGNFGTAGKLSGAGRFHWGTNRVDRSDQSEIRFSMSAASPEASREALPAMFDSGSPIFHIADQQPLLAGITVRVSNRTAPNVGDRAIATGLVGQADWLKKQAPELSWRSERQ